MWVPKSNTNQTVNHWKQQATSLLKDPHPQTSIYYAPFLKYLLSKSSPMPHTIKRTQSMGHKLSKFLFKENLHHPLAKNCSSSSLESLIVVKGTAPICHPPYVESLNCKDPPIFATSQSCIAWLNERFQYSWSCPNSIWSATITSLSSTIRNSSGYVSLRQIAPCHISCQNLTLEQSPMSNQIKRAKLSHSHLIHFHKPTPYGPLTTREHQI